MQKRLVVQQLLERVVGVELGEEQRRISQTRPGDGERGALEELDRARVGVVLRIVGRDGQPLRRDVTPEDERCSRRRRVVQLVVALEGPAAGQVAEPHPELVLVAVLQLAVVGQHRLRRGRPSASVWPGCWRRIRAGLRERAGGIELRGAAVGEDERGAVPLGEVAGQPVRRVDRAVDLRREHLDTGLELGLLRAIVFAASVRAALLRTRTSECQSGSSVSRTSTR